MLKFYIFFAISISVSYSKIKCSSEVTPQCQKLLPNCVKIEEDFKTADAKYQKSLQAMASEEYESGKESYRLKVSEIHKYLKAKMDKISKVSNKCSHLVRPICNKCMNKS